MSEHRSETIALEVLNDIFDAVVNTSESVRIRELMTPSLLKEVLQQAWLFQFDEDRTPFKRVVSDIVRAALDTSEQQEEGV